MVLFEIDRGLFEELKRTYIDQQTYEIALFLNYIELTQKLSND